MRTVVCLLLLAAPAVGQESARELPDAPQPQFASMQPPVMSWVRTSPRPSYVPLTNRQKLDVFVRHTYAKRTFAGVAFDAGISQATSGHEGYGQGAEGFGKRLGASAADNESGLLFQQFLLPAVFHQDPRYFRRPELSTGQRALYALSRVLLTRSDSGSTVFNVSYLGGGLISTTIANSYYPFHERGFENTMQRFGASILSDAGLNVFHEFWPDIKEHLSTTRVVRRLRTSKLGRKVQHGVDSLDK